MTVNQKFNDVAVHLNNTVFEMKDEVRAVMALIVSGQHGFFLGLPGTGKSYLVEQLSKQIECEYFRKLTTATTTPSEFFGPFSLKELKNDKYRYNTAGHLPTAHLAFVDELFKGNSQTLNSLLTAMNERVFDNGSVTEDIPLISLFGASNELPSEDSLQALWDRFTVRMVVHPLGTESSFLAMLKGGTSTPPAKLTVADIEEASNEASKIEVSDEFLKKVYDLRRDLEHSMAGELYVSDRRWKQIVKFMRSLAWLDGAALTSDYFIEISNCLWNDPKQIPKINAVLGKYVDPSIDKARNLYNEVVAIYDGLEGSIADGSINMSDLASGYSQLRDRKDLMEVQIKNSPKVERVLSAVLEDFNQKISSIRDKTLAMQGLK